MFNTEKEMSIYFESYFKQNFGNAYLKEFQGLFGVPDYICYQKNGDNISIISFELKLKNWKTASKQAYRYKSFSDATYVVLPQSLFTTALKNIEYFKKYNIGLALFSNEKELNIVNKPNPCEPYSDNLKLKIRNSIINSRKKIKNIETLIEY